jgi:chromosome segregation protein
MHFSRLRLAGFKSFVEPSEFRIEPGLTGVVGPNGCGKSNVLEAMRWVMGAASAKAMRGEGMDDVIFAGSGGRPARNHAEVTLTIDNPEGDAPAGFNADPVLEVTRRIDRGEGSTYRVNGREVRARDVQILFADASTGANSPALVRQGQISELIAAKPQNRRRILEEAAGVTGLHGRRHEAELRVSAAAANLARLDDLARELESGLARLRREARQAARYKALAAEIRALRASLAQQRWTEARAAVERAGAEAAKAHAELEEAARASAAAQTQALGAEAAIRPLRDEEAAAAAVLGRLAIDKDRLDRDLEQAAAEAGRLTAELERLAEDDAREAERGEDAAQALGRLEADIAILRRELDEAPARAPALEAQLSVVEATRAGADREVEILASGAAAAEAEARTARAALANAEARLARSCAALGQARGELKALGAAPQAGPAAEALGVAADTLTGARETLESAESRRAAAQDAEAVARQTARAAEDELAGATAEARALARATAAPQGAGFTAALEQIIPDAGLEAALAAALGDDLSAALDPRAPSFWGGAKAAAPLWPTGAAPLAGMVKVPPELAARLAFTALVDAADGARLQAGLPPGARLVSREGDLWRWDGFTARAEAPRPAQARLEQRARLSALEARMAELEPAALAARQTHGESGARVEAAETELRAARGALTQAEAALASAREAAESLAREVSRRETRANLLMETIARLETETAEGEQLAAEWRERVAGSEPGEGHAPALEAARTAAAAAREAASRVRAALDAETREREGRATRLAALTGEQNDWNHRADGARRRREGLAAAREQAAKALALARAAPEATQDRLAKLLDALATAESRKIRAVDALAAAERARAATERESRAAESRAADAREARAGINGRLEAARERMAELARALAEASGVAPAELEARFGSETGGAAPGAAEARLATLERERDTMGPVNLRAEDEAAEQGARLAGLNAERADLAGALAKLRQAIGELNAEGRTRLLAAFEIIHGHFRDLFISLFQGGQAELRLVESEDPLEAGLEVLACPPGKRMAVMSLMSGGEQALTAMALIFAVFLSAPAPVCVLDEADAPLDDANVERFCNLLAAMRARAATRFIVITHNPLTMSRMDRLYGVTMREPGVSQLVSVDLRQAEAIAAQ